MGDSAAVAIAVLALTLPAHAFARGGAEDPGAIAGRVESGDGSVVAHADVRLTRLDPELGALSYSATRSAWSEDDGRFRFNAVAAGTWLVEARDGERWQPIPLRVTVGGPADATARVDDVVLHIEPAGCVIGEVRDPDGRPIAGAGVAVGDGGLQGKELEPVTVLDHATGKLVRLKRGLRYPRLPLAMTHTDANGAFRLAPVLPNRPASLRIGGLPRFHDRTITGVVPTASEPGIASVTLDRAAAIIGRVVDEAGVPLPYARVTLRALERHPAKAGWIVLPHEPRAADSLPSTVLLAGEDGLFRFDGLFAGHYLVLAQADGRASGASALLAVTRTDEVLETDVALAPGRTLSGHVVDEDGVACANTSVRVTADSTVPDEVFDFLDPIEVRTRADGSFAIPGLGVGARVSLRVEGDDAGAVTSAAAVTPGAQPLTIALPRAAAGAAIIAAVAETKAAARAARPRPTAPPPARSIRP